jgi:hypothetical protein
MLAFKITLNDRHIALAGAPDLSVLTVFVTASGRLGPAAQSTYAHGNGIYARLNVGGLTNRGSNYRDEFLDWIEHHIEPGDRIRIEIVETEAVDRPDSRKPMVERRREFPKAPRLGLTRRFEPYVRRCKRGIRSIHD